MARYRFVKISFIPISCHLYPIRLTEYKNFTAVNYHKWQVCHCAEVLGNKLRLPVYKFLKEPLIRKFGVDWYNELEQAANAMAQAMYQQQANQANGQGASNNDDNVVDADFTEKN